MLLLLCIGWSHPVWAENNPRVRKLLQLDQHINQSSYTGVIIIPPSECISCGFNAINYIVTSLQSINVVPIVILADKPSIDNRAILRKVKLPDVQRFVIAPDSLSELLAFLHSDLQQGINIYVLDQKQSIATSIKNLRSLEPPVVQEFIEQTAAAAFNNSLLTPLKSIPLYESEEAPIVTLSAVTALDSTLYIADGYSSGEFRVYSINSGNLITKISIEDSIKKIFLKTQQDQEFFHQLSQLGMGAPYISILSSNNTDAYTFVNTIHHFIADTTITLQDSRPDTNIALSFTDGQVLLNIANSKLSKPRAFFNNYYQIRQAKFFNDSTALCQLDFRENINKDSTIDQSTMAIVALVHFKNNHTFDITPILTNRTLKKVSSNFSPTSEFLLTPIDQFHGFIASPVNKGWWRYSMIGDSITLQAISPKGIFAKLVQQDYANISSDSLSLYLANSVLFDDMLYLLIRVTDNSSPHLVLQQYTTISKEPILIAEQIIDAHAIGSDSGDITIADLVRSNSRSLLLLTKSDSSRWKLSTLRAY